MYSFPEALTQPRCCKLNGSLPPTNGRERGPCTIPKAAWRLRAESDGQAGLRKRLDLGRLATLAFVCNEWRLLGFLLASAAILKAT
jgi:hypothetical protein